MSTFLAAISSDISGYRDLSDGVTYQITDKREIYVYKGTAIGQATLLWTNTFSIDKDSSVVLDLATITDINGQSVSLEYIKALKISASKNNLNPVTVRPNTTDGLESIFGGDLTLDPDSNMLFVNVGGSGWTLQNGGKLEFENAGSTSGLTCTVTVIGV